MTGSASCRGRLLKVDEMPTYDWKIEQLKKDAARYRWLRDERSVTIDTMLHGNGCRARSADELDAAIDERMKTPNYNSAT